MTKTTTYNVLLDGKSVELTERRIVLNFNKWMRYYDTIEKVENVEYPFNSLEEYIEQLQNDKAKLWSDDYGKHYYIGVFGFDVDYNKLQEVVRFCEQHNIYIETFDRENTPGF